LKSKILIISFLFILFASCTDSDKALGSNKTAPRGTGPVDQHDTVYPAMQNIKYSLDQLDNSTGLSNSSVNYIFQDSQKLTWIGTWDGLNRYDGSNFKIYRPEPDNENSLSNQVVLKIAEDAAGYIWVLTMHGINRYDKKTDKFQRYYFSGNNNPPLSESQFNMGVNAEGHVFCAVREWGIGYFDGAVFQILNLGILKSKNVKSLEFSTSGELLVLFEDDTLYALSVKNTGKGKAISKASLISRNVRMFNVLQGHGICTISVTGEATLITPDAGKRHIIKGKSIRSIIGQTPQGMIFSGKSGYFMVDFAGKELIMPWAKYLENHKVTTILTGSENVIWAGTDGDGILKLSPLKKSFNLITKVQMPELDGGIVRAFLKDDEKSFWLGTKGKGLFHFTDDFYLEPDKPLEYQNYNENNSGINNAVYALSEGNENLIFIGTDGDGITVFDLETSRLVTWKEIEGSEKCAYFKSTYAVYQDKSGYLWLGTNGYGLIRCKIIRVGGKLKVTDFKKYPAGNSAGMLSSNIIFSIIPKNEDELWVGTRLGGLNLFHKGSERFSNYKNVPNDPRSLSSNDILCLVTDPDDRLWIGTSYGLNLLEGMKDGKTIFKTFTVKDGLPNNTIHGIVQVKNSNLWISTNFGLSNFDSSHSKFINYSRTEGLQNNEFSDGAFYNDRESGYIFMGGTKGFNYFLPHRVIESAHVPELFIDKISGQNQAVPYYQGLMVSPASKTYPSIVLNHNQNFFDIHITAVTYINSEKCKYAYQLKGFDKNWNAIDNRKIISFTNVPRGTYSLWLKWSNSDGVWSKPVRAIDIRINPVWWQSNLAVLIYVLLAASFMLFVRSYYLKRQSLSQNILFRKKEEELHENRLSFFTNIAHEFLTPLTLIVGPVNKLSEAKNLDEKNQKFIHMIQRNASRLLFLTQQLLEFRKAEYDYLEVTVKKFDLVNLIEQIAELFDDWALDKNIDYHIEAPSEMEGWYDKDKLEKIIFNLMSNAFKYTPKNGTISFSGILQDGDYKTLNITIKNSGPGIPKEKMDSLFDRFFLSDSNQKTDTETFRTGIGLAYIKKLVTVLRGEIVVSSIADEETVFTVLIPCEREAFKEQEIDNETAPVLVSHHLKNILEEYPVKANAVPVKISALDALENNKKKILIVEDEKEIHSYLKDLLADTYQIATAYNGAEALEAIGHDMPDIIISDVMMPVMDGVELCKQVKTNISTCHIPFIMLTAKSSVAHRIEGLESGANSYIPKPFYPDHLLVRIQKLLEEKELLLKHFKQDTLVENLPDIPIDNEEKIFIKSVIDLIRKNIEEENLDSEYIMKAFGMSSSQLYRKTKELFGIPPGDLIRTIRLKYAAELLRKNILTVSEVCYKSGFNNRSYFYREFKKVYNTTPKNYQLTYKSKNTSSLNN
jgi:signal transduction histidine kinase/ligand-binding sensor domain-containing protein/AraC-like DNA-binding protein